MYCVHCVLFTFHHFLHAKVWTLFIPLCVCMLLYRQHYIRGITLSFMVAVIIKGLVLIQLLEYYCAKHFKTACWTMF